jgi:hypothetical protein
VPPVGDARAARCSSPGGDDLPAVDIEAFLYPLRWRLRARDGAGRWAGVIQIALFMAILLAGYVYAVAEGDPRDWGRRDRRLTRLISIPILTTTVEKMMAAGARRSGP